MPTTMIDRNSTRAALTASPNTTIPAIATPTAPMPTQTA